MIGNTLFIRSRLANFWSHLPTKRTLFSITLRNIITSRRWMVKPRWHSQSMSTWMSIKCTTTFSWRRARTNSTLTTSKTNSRTRKQDLMWNGTRTSRLSCSKASKEQWLDGIRRSTSLTTFRRLAACSHLSWPALRSSWQAIKTLWRKSPFSSASMERRISRLIRRMLRLPNWMKCP